MIVLSYLVECRQVSKSYSLTALPILNDLNLSLSENESIAIMGPSGVGKTTLLNIIGLLDLPTQGECFVLGQETQALSWAQKAQLRNQAFGFVFQSDRLIPHYTIIENVMLPLYYRKIPTEIAHSLAIKCLEYFNLLDFSSRYPKQLSGGQRQRVGLARAIINQPKVLLADEPTSALDEYTKNSLLDLLFSLKQVFSFSMILVTHDKSVASRCDRVIYL